MKRLVIVLLLSLPLCAFALPISATTMLYVDAWVAQSGAEALDEEVATLEAANAVSVEFPGGKGSGFAIESIVQGTTITWQAETGLEYTVWWSPTLDPPVWQGIGNVLARTYGPLPFFDIGTKRQTGFYRVEQTRPMILVPGSDGGGVDYDFYINKYEVTTTEFARFFSDPGTYFSRLYLGSTAMIASVHEVYPSFMPVTGWEDHPVNDVSWEGRPLSATG